MRVARVYTRPAGNNWWYAPGQRVLHRAARRGTEKHPAAIYYRRLSIIDAGCIAVKRDSPLPYNGAPESRFFYGLLARRTFHLAIFGVPAALLNNDSCLHMSAFCITSWDRYRHRKALRARRKSHFRIFTFFFFRNHFQFFICDSRECASNGNSFHNHRHTENWLFSTEVLSIISIKT